MAEDPVLCIVCVLRVAMEDVPLYFTAGQPGVLPVLTQWLL